MDFFGAQEAAKQRTGWAIFLFVIGVLLTALAVYAAFKFAIHSQAAEVLAAPVNYFDLPQFLWCFFGTIGVVVGASFFKISSLSQGGVSVAQAMGARQISFDTRDEKERRLLNIVEEMAIASGYAIPTVGILDEEENINAFAAALNQRDAVVVVTRGALDQLTRDELQAVIGHEFSHLLNGDSRLNINLYGWIWGLFFLSIIGRIILRSSRGRSSGKKGSGGVIVLFALGLFIIGSIGYLIGRIIQSLISRQREFLADASSVQFTRNPTAMVSALGKIQAGSQIRNPSASGLAHFFFAPSSASGSFVGLFATHPPLQERMKAIDPNYELTLTELAEKPTQEKPAVVETPSAPANALLNNPAAAVTITAGLYDLVGSAGRVPPGSLEHSSEALSKTSVRFEAALSSQQGCEAILLGLALPDAPAERQSCIDALQSKLSAPVFRSLFESEQALRSVDIKERLSLAQLATARIKKISLEECFSLTEALEAIVAFDSQLTAFEALYTEYVRTTLKLPAISPEITPIEAASRVLSFLYLRANDGLAPAADFGTVVKDLATPLCNIRPIKYVSTQSLRSALPWLKQFDYIKRRELLIGAGRILKLDQKVTDEEAEIIRLLAALMDCPIPSRI